MEQGYVHVYTGNGKGKSTAAFGLALRAVGADKHVYIGQFMKKGVYHEIRSFERYLPMVVLEQYGHEKAVFGAVGPEDRAAAAAGLEKAKTALTGGGFDMVILDEINIAAHWGLIQEQDILDVMAAKPPAAELILTGRYAPARVMEKADLVTEMKEVKHYYTKGVPAREGIER